MAYSLILEGQENITINSSPININEKKCSINVTLKPNEKLIIDSELYDIFLNGTSKIETHSGDWFDEFDRDTVSMKIQATQNASNLSSRIVYMERYL